MTTRLTDPTPRAAARIAGLGYVAIFALAIFANFFVRERLVDPDDAAATFRDLAGHHRLVRLAIVAFVVVFVVDVVIAWALHHVFRPAAAALSSLAAWFRIVYTVFLGVAVVFLAVALELTSESDALSGLDRGQREAHTMLALRAFDITWLVGLVGFGAHLALIGTIVLRSAIAPASLGWGLLAAGGAYVLDTVGRTLLPDAAVVTEAVVVVVAVVAEAYFMGWLLTRARRSLPVTAAERPDAPVPA